MYPHKPIPPESIRYDFKNESRGAVAILFVTMIVVPVMCSLSLSLS